MGAKRLDQAFLASMVSGHVVGRESSSKSKWVTMQSSSSPSSKTARSVSSGGSSMVDVVSDELALRFSGFDDVVWREDGGEIEGREEGAWDLAKKVDSLVCPAFGFSHSLSLPFFFCFLEEEPRDSVSVVSLRLKDVEETEGQGSADDGGGV